MIAINFSIAYSVAYISELSLDKILLEHSLLRAITVAISKNLLIITICVIYKFKIKEKNLPNKYLLGLFAFSVLIIFLLLFVGFKYMYFDADDLNVSFALFFIISLFLILMFFFGTIKTAEHYENKQQIELLALRNQMLETSMAETEKTFTLWQSSLHDHKYKIISLLNLLNENKFNELKNELEEENELLSQNLFYYKTGNNAVDSILNIKRTLACEYGITFLINAVLPEKCCITDTHLSIILGNLIDNAISASLNEQNPYIEVSIKMVKDYLTIKVKNRFTQNKEQPKKPTADTHFHGIGQKSVEHIVNNYSGEFRIDIDKESYSVLIIVLDKSNIN
jgi:signal transduction histidine kinase